MIKYTFKHGPFYFNIFANSDTDAVTKIRKALEETAPADTETYLPVDLTAGAFDGRLYLEPAEVSAKDICKREELLEFEEEGVPF